MAHERFLDRDQTPTQEMIQKAIGREIYPVWLDVRQHLDETFPGFEAELIFYSAQHGWAFRYRRQEQQLCLLFPERYGFSALITLNQAEDALAQEKINFFNARLREVLNSPSTLPEGRWLWMRFQDHTDFVGFKILLDIKRKSF